MDGGCTARLLAIVLLTAGAARAQGPQVASRPLAAERYAAEIDRMRWKVQSTTKPATEAEIAALRPIVDALAADLADPRFHWGQKRVTLGALGRLRHAARPAIPAVIRALDLYPEDNGPQGVGHFCEAAETLTAIAPRDERTIRALSTWLQQSAGRQSICHRCGCALKSLEAAGPAAAEIAGPVLEELARSRVLMSDDFQLGRTLAAVGVSANTSGSFIDRVADEGVSTYDRAETLRALARDAGRNLDARRLLDVSTRLSTHPDRNLRQAAVEALGVLGPAALEPLRRTLQDRDYRVRAAALVSLGKLGDAAAPAARDLAEALDPFRGTAHEAIDALVAVGPSVLSALDERARQAPGWLRPLVVATASAVSSGDRAPAEAALGRFRRGPGGHGFVRVEVRREGRGPEYLPHEHRARIHFEGGAIGPGSEGQPRFDLATNEAHGPSVVHAALAGQREGSELDVTLSPEIAQSPLFGTERWMKEERLQHAVPEGVAAAFRVEIESVCRPVVWQPFSNAGWITDLKLEVWCARP